MRPDGTLALPRLRPQARQCASRRWLAVLREWRRRARSRRELATMSELELRDFGASGYDAYYEINKPFWRA